MRASAHAHDGDSAPVSAKGVDVLAHPLKQHPLVPQSQVQTALLLCLHARREPQRADAVVETHGNQRRGSPADKTSHVPLCARAAVEGSAVDVYDDGEFLARRRGRRGGVVIRGRPVNIQIQTILPFPRIHHIRRRAGTYRAERICHNMAILCIR